MSVKKITALDNIFTFRESEKSLKKTPIGFFCAMNKFYEPEKNRNFDARFWEHGKRIKTNAHGPFSFSEVRKSQKKNSP